MTDLFAFRRNLVLAASAGTGKTYTLVGVLLHLLLGLSELGREASEERLHPAIDPSRVVATTFSRKAAAEIRGRLASELEKIALGTESTYRAHFDAATARVHAEPVSDRELARRARRTLERLGHAQVGTLHSFATSLVRAHALELGLLPGFELADEETTRERAVEVAGETIAAFAVDDADTVQDLVRAAGNVGRLVEQVLAVLGRLEEDGRGAADLVLAEDDAENLEALVSETVAHARALADDPKCGNAAKALVRAFAVDQDALLVALPEFLSLRGGRGQSERAQLFFEFRAARLAGAGTLGARGIGLARAYLARHGFLPRARATRELLVQCERAVRRDRFRRGELAFGDVLRAARDLLRDHPAVAAGVGAGLDALLVDEFQDTSRVQRDLVELLWEADPLSRTPGTLPGVTRVRGHGLFVVGDRKQSIYGFRGADVGVFAELCVGLAGWRARTALGIPTTVPIPEPSAPTADFVPLQHNRRGADELLTFANAFSARRLDGSGRDLFAIKYVPETEDLHPPPERAPTPAPSPRTTWLKPPLADKSRTTPLSEAFVIADRIRRILDEGAPLVRGAAPTARDIAVLAHTNAVLETCAYALADAQIPYVVAGRGFYSAREVRDVVALLGLVLRPHDRLALLAVLRGPWAGVSDRALLALGAGDRGLPEGRARWDAALRAPLDEREHARIARVIDVVERLRRNVDRFTPDALLREAVRALELEEALLALPRGAQRVANVEKLLTLARRETDAGLLLERLEAACERDAMETEAATFSDEDDAVRLLTVHASKGLDFPIVFVPEIGAEPPRAESASIFVDLGGAGEPARLAMRSVDASSGRLDPPSFSRARERDAARLRAERARLAYVAVTRASEAMYLVGDRRPPRDEKGDSSAFRASIVGVLTDVAPDEEAARRAQLAIEAVSVAAHARLAEPVACDAAPLDELRVPRPPAWGAAVIATTSLQDFHHCARRFQLVHLLDLPERDLPRTVVPDAPRDPDAEARAPLDPRAEGTLVHRVLELVPLEAFGSPDAEVHAKAALGEIDASAERRIVTRAARFLASAYAAEVRRAGAKVLRELPFVFPVVDAAGRKLALRGTMDLLVQWPDGRVDVVDYKRARGPSIEPHAFQLTAYTLAARAFAPEATAVRAGIVFLGGEANEPRWQPPFDPARGASALADLAARLIEARWQEAFPRVGPDRCRAIHCGYVGYCHPAPRTSQLRLFAGGPEVG